MQHDRTFVISILSISSPLACIFMTRSKCDERAKRARIVPLGGTKMIFQMTPKTKVNHGLREEKLRAWTQSCAKQTRNVLSCTPLWF